MALSDYIGFEAAAKLLPGKSSKYTLYGWCRDGLPGPDGKRIFLQFVQVGRKVYTTAAWLEEFIKLVAEASRQKAQQRTRFTPSTGMRIPTQEEAKAIVGGKRASFA